MYDGGSVRSFNSHLANISDWHKISTLINITHNSDDRPVNGRSKSFKVIDFFCNRKTIYDFILVINRHLTSISHHFRDIASRSQKPPHPRLSPRSRVPRSNYVIELGKQRDKASGYILMKTAWSWPQLFGQYTHITDNLTLNWGSRSLTSVAFESPYMTLY